MSANPTHPARLGMRYGQMWATKKDWLFDAEKGMLLRATPQNPGHTPEAPPLRVAVEGIQRSYHRSPIMGTDPEFFLKRDGGIVPAFDFLPDKHLSLDGLFWDGFQAETTVDLKACHSWCQPNCPNHKVEDLKVLAQKIGRQMTRLTHRSLNVAPMSVWRVPSLMLKLASDAHVSLGCEPSRNAYASEGRRVEQPRMLKWRFAGGHVHFELPEEERSIPNIQYLVKTLDALLGLPCVCLAQNYDHFIRRRYYGLAGEYRLPPHGLEYRTLSNFWLMDPKAFSLVFELARQALNIGRARMRNIFVGISQEQRIRDTINYCDVRSAKDFMHLNRDFYSAWAKWMYNTDEAFWQAIEGGLDKVLPHWGENVVARWQVWGPSDYVPCWKDLK